MNKWYKSHKFWSAMIAGIVAIAREYGVDIPVELLWIALGYMGIRGVVDTGKAVAAKPSQAPEKPQIEAQRGLEPIRDIPPAVLPEEVRMGSAKSAFQRHLRSTWEADNLEAVTVEAAIIDHYEAQVSLAKEMWKEARGYYPEKIEEPCDSGDWSYESRWLWHSSRELTIQRDFLTAMKKTPAMGYQMGGVGYLFHREWNDIPSWARLNLLTHLKGHKWEFRL